MMCIALSKASCRISCGVGMTSLLWEPPVTPLGISLVWSFFFSSVRSDCGDPFSDEGVVGSVSFSAFLVFPPLSGFIFPDWSSSISVLFKEALSDKTLLQLRKKLVTQSENELHEYFTFRTFFPVLLYSIKYSNFVCVLYLKCTKFFTAMCNFLVVLAPMSKVLTEYQCEEQHVNWIQEQTS